MAGGDGDQSAVEGDFRDRERGRRIRLDKHVARTAVDCAVVTPASEEWGIFKHGLPACAGRGVVIADGNGETCPPSSDEANALNVLSLRKREDELMTPRFKLHASCVIPIQQAFRVAHASVAVGLQIKCLNGCVVPLIGSGVRRGDGGECGG